MPLEIGLSQRRSLSNDVHVVTAYAIDSFGNTSTSSDDFSFYIGAPMMTM
tara:strand:- start:763 stop:912 length:150 start_codon:yes stop_codon:yes gene_type:complete